MHANTHQNTHARYCSLLSYRAVRFGRLLPTLGPTPTRDRPNMAQSHEDRKRSRRECGSCGHPDRRLFAARAVRVAYRYARAPLLPPDPPRHRPDPPGPPRRRSMWPTGSGAGGESGRVQTQRRPLDRRRGGRSSGRVRQRRTIGTGAGSGKAEVGGSVGRR